MWLLVLLFTAERCFELIASFVVLLAESSQSYHAVSWKSFVLLRLVESSILSHNWHLMITIRDSQTAFSKQIPLSSLSIKIAKHIWSKRRINRHSRHQWYVCGSNSRRQEWCLLMRLKQLASVSFFAQSNGNFIRFNLFSNQKLTTPVVERRGSSLESNCIAHKMITF